uniref:EF-hand domain-containing protein n=1 Tax=Anopheles maculatus TaxID=74869 RepID=A0A182SYG6_9DIPT
MNYIEAAATKIQAAFRGHQVRKDMKQGDGVTEQGQQKQDQQTEREPTKEELEAEFDPNDQGKLDVVAVQDILANAKTAWRMWIILSRKHNVGSYFWEAHGLPVRSN